MTMRAEVFERLLLESPAADSWLVLSTRWAPAGAAVPTTMPSAAAASSHFFEHDRALLGVTEPSYGKTVVDLPPGFGVAQKLGS